MQKHIFKPARPSSLAMAYQKFIPDDEPVSAPRKLKRLFDNATYLVQAVELVQQGDHAWATGITSILSKEPRFMAALDVPMEIKSAIGLYFVRDTLQEHYGFRYIEKERPEDEQRLAQNRAAIEAAEGIIPQIGEMAKSQIIPLIRELQQIDHFNDAFLYCYHVGCLKDNKALRAFIIEHGQPDIDFRDSHFPTVRELATQRGDTHLLNMPSRKAGLPAASSTAAAPALETPAVTACARARGKIPLHRLGAKAFTDPRVAHMFRKICRKGQGQPADESEVPPPANSADTLRND